MAFERLDASKPGPACFDAALAEIAQRGLAAADVSAIAAAAGVVRGTFYFHFPTKEHVLTEVERSEEARIVGELGERQRAIWPRYLSRLDRAMCSRPNAVWAQPAFQRHAAVCTSRHHVRSRTSLAQHPLAEFLVSVDQPGPSPRGKSPRTSTRRNSGRSSLTGSSRSWPPGHTIAALLSRYVTTIVKGMEKR